MVIILITAAIATLAIILVTVVVLEAEDPTVVAGAEDVEDLDRTGGSTRRNYGRSSSSVLMGIPSIMPFST